MAEYRSEKNVLVLKCRKDEMAYVIGFGDFRPMPGKEIIIIHPEDLCGVKENYILTYDTIIFSNNNEVNNFQEACNNNSTCWIKNADDKVWSDLMREYNCK